MSCYPAYVRRMVLFLAALPGFLLLSLVRLPAEFLRGLLQLVVGGGHTLVRVPLAFQVFPGEHLFMLVEHTVSEGVRTLLVRVVGPAQEFVA